MSSEFPSDQTGEYGLGEGLRLYDRGKDHGEWLPFIAWLGEHPELAAEVAESIRDDNRTRRATASLRPSPVGTGSMVGEFEIREEIGRGAMGVVYRAFDTKLKREVALKMVRDGRDLSARELARLRFEAETVAALDHENVVPILSFGEHDGCPYLVMPLMQGGSLSAWLKARGPNRCLPFKEAAELVRDVALGVHHAHQRGLIHRDLKPGNILLDEKGQPHVADFGLACRLDEALSTGIVGTVAYMAPEQARGEKSLTTAVDVHALGVILFELLTGGLPYGGADIASVLRRLADETEPTPPVSRFRRDVPRDLEDICMRCLSRVPGDRYASAQALAEALDRYLAGEPQTDAPRRSWWADLPRIIRRRKAPSTMVIWPAFFWGTGTHLISQVTIQAAVLTDSPAWVAYLGWAVYFAGWLGVTWLCGLARLGELNRIERTGIAQHIGMMLAGLALIPFSLATPDGHMLAMYPPLLAIIGLGTFIAGSHHWGRFYVVGGVLMLWAAIMPLFPARHWPALFAAPNIVGMIWVGFQLRADDREARAADALPQS